MNRYDRCINKWNDIFADKTSSLPKSADIGQPELNEALDWLCEGSESIMDFGCGSGVMLFYCALRGTKQHLGIDLSENGIELACELSRKVVNGTFDFRVGSLEVLGEINSESYDGIILSNIIDNLYPEDSEVLASESRRILKRGGKILVKVNDYITPAHVREWEMKELAENVYDDGFLIWNLEDESWVKFLTGYFQLYKSQRAYFQVFEVYNRIFQLIKQ